MTARIAFQFPHERNAPRAELLSYVRLVDELGYDTIFVPEAWGRDAFTTLGWIAANTSRTRLGSGIVNVFSRTPALIAQSIATLDEISGGRAVLGLGTSGPAVIRNWHGMTFEKGRQRMRETVDIVRKALTGAGIDYHGEIFNISNFKLGFKPVRDRIPIYIASMGPNNNALTGAIADGWTPIWLPFDGIPAAQQELRPYLPEFLVSLREQLSPVELTTLEEKVNSNKPIDIAPCVMACVMDSVEDARDMVRSHLAFYVGGMGTFYRDTVARFGFAEEAANVHRLWQARFRKEAVAAVSDAMVDAVAVAGPRERCRRRLDAYRRAGVDMPVLVIPHGATPEIIRTTLEALA